MHFNNNSVENTFHNDIAQMITWRLRNNSYFKLHNRRDPEIPFVLSKNYVHTCQKACFINLQLLSFREKFKGMDLTEGEDSEKIRFEDSLIPEDVLGEAE